MRRAGKVTLELMGHVPAKKNLWKRGKRSMFIDTDTRSKLEFLELQACGQWGKRKPVEHPAITATFYVRDERGDLDNKWTTIQDVLVKAGVLVNDNMKRLHGPITFSGQVDERERVVIELEAHGGAA